MQPLSPPPRQYGGSLDRTQEMAARDRATTELATALKSRLPRARSRGSGYEQREKVGAQTSPDCIAPLILLFHRYLLSIRELYMSFVTETRNILTYRRLDDCP